ncbi:hypothetical protein WT08_12510 [Burkholderia sp. MSMB1552]|nr:hypothetical protein AQ610_23615 [Burkholderia humptydooensis]KVN11832.1 hypothetical protein WT08_12510 [Burkholderia sp. MSMB1552]KWZ51535.1 hypothetical protein WS92_25185 [Burkholderia sp. MSMB1588]
MVSALASDGTPTSSAAATATAAATTDLFGLPRAESSSEAATHAPSASFQIERYERFIRKRPPRAAQHGSVICLT